MPRKQKPKTPEAQREAWKAWAARNPDKVQANRDKWAKSPAGRAWLAANQAKKNARRDAWRARKKAEAAAKKPDGDDSSNTEV